MFFVCLSGHLQTGDRGPSLCLSHALFPSSPLCLAHTHTHTQRDTRGSVDAALSALRWGVLLLTAVWIEAAVHPLLSGCCRAAGLAFVLHSIMARHNYSLSRDGTQAASTFALASLHLAEQHRHTQAHTIFMCTQVNMSVRYMCHCYKNRFPCPCWFWHILKVLLHLKALNHK